MFAVDIARRETRHRSLRLPHIRRCAHREASVIEIGPMWMTNVMGATGDRDTTLPITLDGMPNSRGEIGNWNTPQDIADAFQRAAQHGSQFNTSNEANYPRRGDGTAWEMSEVAYAVHNYDGAAAWRDP
ncbi:hypothetical protein [Streptomyces sp. NPDC090132]|uniref:hypothetical protein n=1 Tax=Streptomyces sp. NPDC090132 TaxID=3365955 RepID=UPI0032506F5D